MTADAQKLRSEIEVLENTIGKCEEDKSTKDNQIRTLRDEIAHQEELISKLNKEKKSTGNILFILYNLICDLAIDIQCSKKL